METARPNIHPIFPKMLDRGSKEALLRQTGHVVWLYGLSGSGKSTIAIALERRLHERRALTQILDGDNIRAGLNKGLGFSDEDRLENIRRVAEVAKLYAGTGIVTITSFITPHVVLRSLARTIVGSRDLTEVYLECSFATCRKRDVKGLYAKAESGQIPQFTGKDSTFEPPDAAAPADLVISTESSSVQECVEVILHAIETKIAWSPSQ